MKISLCRLLCVTIAAWAPVATIAQVEVRETANSAHPLTPMPTAPSMAAPSAALSVNDSADPMFGTPPIAIALKPTTGTMSPPVQATAHHKKSNVVQAAVPTAMAQPSGSLKPGIDHERVVFNRLPVHVLLRTGQERVLSFANSVTLDVPDDLQSTLTPMDIIGNTVYITAAAPFKHARVIVSDLVTGQMMPLDLESSPDAAASGILEVTAAGSRQNDRVIDKKSSSDADDGEPDTEVDMATLTRYAAHMLYAPRRLMTPEPGIRQVAVPVKPVTGLYRSALLETTPIGAWRSQDFYVTAVKFVNRGKMPVELDFSELRGHWVAATAQHGRIAAAGSDSDTTAVYLISERPFEEPR